MGWSQAAARKLDEIAAAGQSFSESTREAKYEDVSMPLAELKRELHEQMRAATAEEVGRIIKTLRADGALQPGDLDLIRLWVVGDAEHYIRMENDFAARLTELNRLLGSLNYMRREAAAPAAIARMAATVRDALRVIADITLFKREEARVRNFERASARLTADDKKLVARILQEKLSSAAA